MKKIMLRYGIPMVVTIALASCNGDATDEPQETETSDVDTDKENNTETDTADTEAASESESSTDQELTETLIAEEGVNGGEAYQDEDIGIVTISFNEDVSDEEAKKLAENYGQQAKERFDVESVNVQGVRDGENIVNIQF